MVEHSEFSPLSTHALVLETSIGPLVIDLFGVDLPLAISNIIGLSLAKYFNGMIAFECIPSSILRFSHPCKSLRSASFNSLSGTPSDDHSIRVQKEFFSINDRKYSVCDARIKPKTLKGSDLRIKRINNHAHRHKNVSDFSKSGCLLTQIIVENRDDGQFISFSPHITLTLSSRNVDYLSNDHVIVGTVAKGYEGNLNKLRIISEAHRSISSSVPPSCGFSYSPICLARIKHSTIITNSLVINSLINYDEKKYKSLIFPSTTFILKANEGIIGSIRADNCEFFNINTLPSPEFRMEAFQDLHSIEYNENYHADFLSSDDDDKDTPEDNIQGCEFLSNAKYSNKVRKSEVSSELNQHKINQTRAIMLQVLDGQSTDNEILPPENALFVCRLSPFTTSEGLSMCFSRFGRVLHAEIIYDKKTKQSLRYGFVTFETVDACNAAYKAMDNVLIDDSRIHVDFSQSILHGHRKVPAISKP